MTKRRLPLSKCKLWWPAWQQGIPFASFGYAHEVTGEGYRFSIDPEMDSWLCENGDLMPISTAVLENCNTGPIKCTSFTILSNGKVQVNYRLPNNRTETYHVHYYPIEELSFVGETYSLDE